MKDFKNQSTVKSAEEAKEGEIYSKIWEALNQTSLENLEEESANFPTEINQQEVQAYFAQTSQSKVINLTSLSEEDKSFLESAGLSLTYLNRNRRVVMPIISKVKLAVKNIFQPRDSQEYKKILKTFLKTWLGRIGLIKKGGFRNQSSQVQSRENFLQQQLLVQDGYICAICPSTGRILKSNSSVFLSQNFVLYRFLGNEVFYLILSGNSFKKDAIYFPRLDLIVYLRTEEDLEKQTKFLPQLSPSLKASLVTYWSKLKPYILSTGKAEKVAVVGINLSIWHHLFNDLSGIQKMSESGCLNQIDKFLVIGPEYYGGIDEIFPEIPPEKVQRFNFWRTRQSTSHGYGTKDPGIKDRDLAVNHEILGNRFFAFKLGDYPPDKKLTKRIYQVSRRKCSAAFLGELEEAKENHFPLFWISCRTHYRTWISQEEGIANIVNSLSEKFPNLAVIFDGYTRLDIGGELLTSAKDEEIIKQEKDTLTKIQSLFYPGIKVYDLIGCPMYEVIVWANAIDLYFIPIGSGDAKMSFMKGQGVQPGNKAMPGSIPKHCIVDVPQKGEGKDMHYSYDFDWRIAYEQLLKLASSLTRD